MCGIVGYIGERSCAEILLDGLSKLEYRGYDSAGISVLTEEGIRTVKRRGRLQNLRGAVETAKLTGNCGIGHTRWATHGEPSDRNSHPHGTGRLSLVHNGIIENYLGIREMLERRGYVFESETDTEAAAKLIDFCYKGDPLAALREALPVLRGSYAFSVIFADYPGKIFAVRRDSPLIVGLSEEGNFTASDIPAILRYTRRYLLLDTDEIAVVERERVTVFDVAGNRVEKEVKTADFDMGAAEKGGYPHFMLKEIHEQPKALRDTIQPRLEDGLPRFSELPDDFFDGITKIYIVACGTAMHAGLVGRCAIERYAGIPVEVDLASEFRYREPLLDPEHHLFVCITQSGETADSLAALRLAKARGVRTLSVVNVLGSTISRESDQVLYTYAGPEIAVASTKAYSVQLAVMYLLALRLALLRKGISEEEVRRLTAELCRMPEVVEQVLAREDEIHHIAAACQNAHDLFFIGRGLDYALSQEGSLKLKEISYIHSEAYAAGELKHGTISLVTDGVPVFALATQYGLYEKMIGNIKEVKARGAQVVLLHREKAADVGKIADLSFALPQMEELFCPIPGVTVLQLFAYYCSLLRGCDVDKPRNLAKSVTVE